MKNYILPIILLFTINAQAGTQCSKREIGPFNFSCSSENRPEKVICIIKLNDEVLSITTLMPLSPLSNLSLAMDGKELDGKIFASWDMQSKTKKVHGEFKFSEEGQEKREFKGVLFQLNSRSQSCH